VLKEIDEEYRTTLINFAKYKLVMFAMAKLMEMKTTEQNQVALYLFNSVGIWKNIISMLYWIRYILFSELERKNKNGKRKFQKICDIFI